MHKLHSVFKESRLLHRSHFSRKRKSLLCLAAQQCFFTSLATKFELSLCSFRKKKLSSKCVLYENICSSSRKNSIGFHLFQFVTKQGLLRIVVYNNGVRRSPILTILYTLIAQKYKKNLTN